MTEQDLTRARAALLAIDMFWSLEPHSWVFRRIGGITNDLFFVDHAGEQYVLRLPGTGTEDYIDRHFEEACAREAARVGVAPDMLYFNKATGVMVTRFIDDGATMSVGRFRERPEALHRAIENLRTLHNSDANFLKDFGYFSRLNAYLKLLTSKGVALPPGYHEIMQEAQVLRTALATHPLPRVACHCEPMCENFIDTPRRMWVVDWEYAGMADPLWDIAQLAIEAERPEAEDEALLKLYLKRDAKPAEMGRHVIYRVLGDLLWTVWALIQHANNNPAEDFLKQSQTRFGRASQLMRSATFAAHVNAVRKGI